MTSLQPAAAPASQVFINLPDIVRSKTNPRKTFDKDRLAELTASVKAHGVLQPILVRPNGKEGTYELVAGERRFRAAQAAGLASIPAMVRELTDVQVLEVQVIENLQRDDLHPLEEAEGYRQLHEKHGYSVEDLAAKVGKSKAYVYARLKLCDLAPAARKPFVEGKVSASIALLVARIPDPKLAEQAMKEIATPRHEREPLSYREAFEHIQHRYMTALSDAPWEKDDAALLPAAGPCTTCPKRTGNQAELFGDVKSPDVCTDVTCFGKKRKLFIERRLDQARAAGMKVIEGKAAEKMEYDRSLVRLDSHADAVPYGSKLYGKTYRALLGKSVEPSVLLAVPQRHYGAKPGEVELIEAAPRAEVLKAIREKYPQAAVSSSTSRSSSAADTARKKRALHMAKVHAAAVDQMVGTAAARPADLGFWRFILTALVRHSWHAVCVEVLKRRGVELKRSSDASTQVRKLADGMKTDGELRALLVEILTTRDSSYEWRGDGYADALKAGCQLYGVNLKKLDASMKAAAAKKPARKGKK
jgi:ParB/RepB/Spo0J family partition protein